MDGYAQIILEKSGQFRDGRGRIQRNVNSVSCAFCRGTGRDPKMEIASCPVCRGAKKIGVIPPVVDCLICGGAGVGSGGMSCMGCRGIGVISVPKDSQTCGACHGTGTWGEGAFCCSECHGQGIC